MTPREALEARAGGDLSWSGLARALVAHPTWEVPVQGFPEGLHRPLFGAGDDARTLLFSSSEALGIWQAQAESVPFVTLDGVAALGGLPPVGLRVDPGSGHAADFDAARAADLALFAQGVELERVLAGDPSVEDGWRKLVDYPGWGVVFRGDPETGHTDLVLAPDRQGRRLAGVCTAPDCLDAFVDQIERELGVAVFTTRMDGRQLFEMLSALPIDGIVFNCSGPVPPRAVALAFAAQVLARA